MVNGNRIVVNMMNTARRLGPGRVVMMHHVVPGDMVVMCLAGNWRMYNVICPILDYPAGIYRHEIPE